ncbi:MAG: helix-turn-helix transcriptional regulator [Chloroflexota bacterium]
MIVQTGMSRRAGSIASMRAMVRTTPAIADPASVALELDCACRSMGAAIRAGRQAQRLSLQGVAEAAALSRTVVGKIERGRPASLATYLRIADVLGMRLTWDLQPLSTTLDVEDAVHAAMGEVQARRFGVGSREVLIDEPYQHFRFAGRGDVVVVDRERRAMEHSENKTRIVNVGELGGSFNAKCLWLAEHVAERYRLPRFRSQTHVLVLLWSEEVLAVARTLGRTLRALGPSGIRPFAAWWDGSPLPGAHRSVVVLDPIDRGTSQPQWASIEDALELRPRYRGYADAHLELQQSGPR